MGIVIKDLEKNEELDRDAMRRLKGGSKNPRVGADHLQPEAALSVLRKKACPLSKNPFRKEDDSETR